MFKKEDSCSTGQNLSIELKTHDTKPNSFIRYQTVIFTDCKLE